MATRLVTNNQRLHTARQLLESVSEEANTRYYAFVGDHLTHGDTTISEVYDTVQETVTNVYKNMIFGKRIEQADLKLMIRNIPYESGQVYSMYDDTNKELFSEDFYVVVNASSYSHVFKCLDNNLGAVSTIEPNFTHVIGSNTMVYQTSDGYRWKYMCTVDSANVAKFSSEELFPIIANTDVTQAAVEGAIDVVYIEGEGKGYDNYLTGTFDASDIRVGGNSTVYSLSNTTASAVNGFYTDCLLYISSGTGSGQHKNITQYYSNSTGKYIVVDSQFATVPTNGSEYEIYPQVRIIGNGTQTVNAVARALVNTHASNSIYRVEMLERGRDYQYATAEVLASTVVAVDAKALVRPIVPPPGGHGYDIGQELGAKALCFATKFVNSEGNTIPTDNKFQQLGILIDPLFANVQLETINQSGVFTLGETVYEIAPAQVNIDVSLTTVSDTVTCPTADFEHQFKPGDFVYFKSANGLSHQLVQVSSVTNSSVLELSSNGYFTDANCTMYYPNKSAKGTVTSSNSSHTTLTRVDGDILPNSIIVGTNSGAVATVNAVSRGGESKSYGTFIQMHKYETILNSGQFLENEVVRQGNSSAILHSTFSDSGTLTLYTTNQFGKFTTGTVTGANSGAVATITETFGPELIVGSGSVIFLENVDGVERSANTSETLQIVFDY